MRIPAGWPLILNTHLLLTASAPGRDTNREGSNRGHGTRDTGHGTLDTGQTDTGHRTDGQTPDGQTPDRHRTLDELKFDKNAIQKIMKYH